MDFEIQEITMGMPAAAGAVATGAAGSVISDLVGKLTDPTFNEGLSPSQGLVVTPHTFSCVEQEGRWKSIHWGYNKDRELTSPILNPQPLLADPPQDPVTPPATAQNKALFSLLIRQAPIPSQIALGLAASILIPVPGAGGELVTLLNMSSVGMDNLALIDVTWWDDGLEIWGGYAGLAAKTQGFGSVFGHRGRIDLAGCQFGNFLPARYLITGTGWVNPVGPQYYEFRWGVVIRAGSSGVTPLFGSVWDRDGNVGQLSAGSGGAGFSFTVPNWTSLSSVLAAHA